MEVKQRPIARSCLWELVFLGLDPKDVMRSIPLLLLVVSAVTAATPTIFPANPYTQWENQVGASRSGTIHVPLSDGDDYIALKR